MLQKNQNFQTAWTWKPDDSLFDFEVINNIAQIYSTYLIYSLRIVHIKEYTKIYSKWERETYDRNESTKTTKILKQQIEK
jgi:hypothetical protein